MEQHTHVAGALGPSVPYRCTRRAVGVGVVCADEARPVALCDGDDGVVGASGCIGGWCAAVGVVGAEDGVDFDCVADAEA